MYGLHIHFLQACALCHASRGGHQANEQEQQHILQCTVCMDGEHCGHLHSDWGAIPDATVDLSKGALPNERAQLHILPRMFLSSAAHLQHPLSFTSMPAAARPGRQAQCLFRQAETWIHLRSAAPISHTW